MSEMQIEGNFNDYIESLKALDKDKITVAVLDQAVVNCFIRRAEHVAQKKYTTEIWNEVEEIQTAVGVMYEKLDIKKHSSKLGTLSMSLVEGYALPKDDESREQFFAYMKERGVFNTMITVNAATLNTFVKDEVEMKETEGEFDFVPDGIMRKDPQLKYSMRK